MSVGQREPTRRLFFALWPDAEARLALARASRKAVRSCGGRPVPPENAHVTLAFLGSVAERRVAEVDAIGRNTASALALAAPLTLSFGTLVHWARGEILAAVVDEEPQSLQQLAAALKDATAAAGFTPDLKPFRPHVTVARKVAHRIAPSVLTGVTWCFDTFALVASRTTPGGSVYSVLESYLLVKEQKSRE